MKEGEHTVNSELLAKLQKAAALPEEQINRSDPDAPFGTDWTKGVRGRFYRPPASIINLRAWSDASNFVPQFVEKEREATNPDTMLEIELIISGLTTSNAQLKRYYGIANGRYMESQQGKHMKKPQRQLA